MTDSCLDLIMIRCVHGRGIPVFSLNFWWYWYASTNRQLIRYPLSMAINVHDIIICEIIAQYPQCGGACDQSFILRYVVVKVGATT